MWLNLLFLIFCTLAWADNPPETIYDEGTRQGVAYKLDCVGSGIACTQSGITGTINVAGATSSNWTNSGSDVTLAGGNVGIGTTLTTTSALTVMNGNVGIGTWKPTALLDFGKNHLAQVTNSGAIYASALQVTETTNGNGIYISAHPGHPTSNVGTLLLYDSGNYWEAPNPSIVFKSAGLATMGAIMSWSDGDSSNNGALVFFVANGSGPSESFRASRTGNVGVGYQSAINGKLVVNGNVGIGTNLPSTLLEVGAQKFNVTTGGNVGVGSITPGTALDVQGTIRAPATGWNIGIGTASPTRVCITNTTWSVCP